MSYKRGHLDRRSLETLANSIEMELAAISRDRGPNAPGVIFVGGGSGGGTTTGLVVTVATATTSSPQTISFPSMGTTAYSVFAFIILSTGDFEICVPQIPPLTDTRTDTTVQVSYVNSGILYAFMVKQ